MKKVLLTTTALIMTAGVAAAEITFSGKAEVGVIKTGKSAAKAAPADADGSLAAAVSTADAALATAATKWAAGEISSAKYLEAYDNAYAAWLATQPTAAKDAAKDFTVYSGVDINIAASAEASNGMTIAIATDIGAGSIADVADKEIDAQGETITAPTVTIGMAGLTITAGNDLVDDYYDGDLSDYDLGVAGTQSGVNYGIAFNTEKAASSQWTATAGMDMGDISLDIHANEVDGGENQTKIVLGYTMDALTFTVTNDNKGAAKDIATVKVAYAEGPFTASISQANDKDHAANTNKGGKASWDLALGYTMGAATVSYSTNESSKWEADVAYDLGGANAFIATDSKETVIAGVNFSF
jgi:hypothetical protein